MTLIVLFAAEDEGGPCWDFDGASTFTYVGCDDGD